MDAERPVLQGRVLQRCKSTRATGAQASRRTTFAIVGLAPLLALASQTAALLPVWSIPQKRNTVRVDFAVRYAPGVTLAIMRYGPEMAAVRNADEAEAISQR